MLQVLPVPTHPLNYVTSGFFFYCTVFFKWYFQLYILIVETKSSGNWTKYLLMFVPPQGHYCSLPPEFNKATSKVNESIHSITSLSPIFGFVFVLEAIILLFEL